MKTKLVAVKPFATPIIAIALASVIGVSAQAAAPSQLLGKTITFSYTVSAPLKHPDGSIKVGIRTETRIVYVSAAGRLFVRNMRRNNAGATDQSEQGPAQNAGSVRLAGNSIVGTVQRLSGAYQFTIKFDPGYQNCSAEMVFGLAEGERHTKFAGVGGVALEGAGRRSVSTSCSIASGNGL
jgi:hypothetical protein